MGASPRSGLQGVTRRHGLRPNPYTGRSFLSRSSSIPSGGRADLGWYNGWPNFRTLCISALDAKTRHHDGCAAEGGPLQMAALSSFPLLPPSLSLPLLPPTCGLMMDVFCHCHLSLHNFTRRSPFHKSFCWRLLQKHRGHPPHPL
jgi:hypothetical protein